MADSDSKLRNPGGDTHAEFDRDVNIRGVVWSGVGLAVITAVAFVLMWFLFKGLTAYEERRDPEPLPMPEATEAVVPPGPRLQSTPEEDLEAMLAQEEALLESYSLVEEGGAYARIPIERAMELALERGLGDGARAVPQPGAAAPAAGADGMPAGGAEVEQPGTPPGGPAGSATTEGHDAQ